MVASAQSILVMSNDDLLTAFADIVEVSCLISPIGNAQSLIDKSTTDE